MLAARRLQSACPPCTAQILKLYAHSIAEISPAIAPNSRPTPSRSRFRSRRQNARLLSTASRNLQDGRTQDAAESQTPGQAPEELAARPNEARSPPDQDPETVVRQAKRMFGDTLPKGYLSNEEYVVYERLYGAPLRRTSPEDVGFGSFGEFDQRDALGVAKNTLLRETRHGRLEEVEYTSQSIPIPDAGEVEAAVAEELLTARPPSDAQLEYIEANASNQREYDALIQLQKDFEAARIAAVQDAVVAATEAAANEALLGEEDIEEEYEDEDQEQEQGEEEDIDDTEPDAQLLDWYPGQEGPRQHQYTTEGQFRTYPSTLQLPGVNFVEPITELLRRTDTKHIRATAEKHFGGPGLPHSPATTRSAKNLPQKGLGMEAGHHKMSEIDADAFIATALPGIYASVTSTLVEVRKRLGPEWLRGLLSRKDADGEGPRVLDTGAGGAGLAAWQSVLQAEWDMLRDNNAETANAETADADPTPPGKRTVVVGSNQLRHRISSFLENTQFLPRLPNYTHSLDNMEKQLDAPEVPQKRKVYDVIIATHLLMPLEKEYRRKDILNQLWSLLSPEGGVLIVLEKGHPRGFEAIADVRDRLLAEFIVPPTPAGAPEAIEQDVERIREPGMIVAPCTNHTKCPMYLSPGLSPGRKDFCHFSQRFIRPPFLQRILEAKHRNHEDIDFSYIAVRRGMPGSSPTLADASSSTVESSSRPVGMKPVRQGAEATTQAFAGYEAVASDSPDRPHALSLPRNILPPLKRKGHVTLDLCTPAGTIERWTVPRSFSKQAYHDARKARWGDLWALGAKTRVRRHVRLGRGIAEDEVIPQDGGVRATRAVASGKKGRPKVVDLEYDGKGVLSGRPRGLVGQRPERRTKRGRKPPRLRNKLKDLEEEDE
ncbi:37S ribosomal protein Rsm22 [Diaporthe helianthi]|uniref:37S ribosomal protein Rsm22 n=1 Tax=Diaporthe helianthi TaxID=158607 RepID=A0A2P5HYI6_DIAHE|nr:37S ribosomal protein Rsm22 [Diaporthe helianthi]